MRAQTSSIPPTETTRRQSTRTGKGSNGLTVGGSDSDKLIFEEMRRNLESMTILPENQPFLLSTNPAIIPDASIGHQNALAVNPKMEDNYFNRPEVVRAFNTQKLIETPEFEKHPRQDPGRRRARSNANESQFDVLSEEASMKKFKRFEGFEKRLRGREIEKARSDLYHLKQRLEQLEVTESGAFMHPDLEQVTSTPPSNFVPEVREGRSLGEPKVYTEGLRRQKEMLDAGHSLVDKFTMWINANSEKGKGQTKAKGGAASQAIASGSTTPSPSKQSTSALPKPLTSGKSGNGSTRSASVSQGHSPTSAIPEVLSPVAFTSTPAIPAAAKPRGRPKGRPRVNSIAQMPPPAVPVVPLPSTHYQEEFPLPLPDLASGTLSPPKRVMSLPVPQQILDSAPQQTETVPGQMFRVFSLNDEPPMSSIRTSAQEDLVLSLKPLPQGPLPLPFPSSSPSTNGNNHHFPLENSATRPLLSGGALFTPSPPTSSTGVAGNLHHQSEHDDHLPSSNTVAPLFLPSVEDRLAASQLPDSARPERVDKDKVKKRKRQPSISQETEDSAANTAQALSNAFNSQQQEVDSGRVDHVYRDEISTSKRRRKVKPGFPSTLAGTARNGLAEGSDRNMDSPVVGRLSPSSSALFPLVGNEQIERAVAAPNSEEADEVEPSLPPSVAPFSLPLDDAPSVSPDRESIRNASTEINDSLGSSDGRKYSASDDPLLSNELEYPQHSQVNPPTTPTIDTDQTSPSTRAINVCPCNQCREAKIPCFVGSKGPGLSCEPCEQKDQTCLVDTEQNTPKCSRCTTLRKDCWGGPPCTQCVRAKNPCDLKEIQATMSKALPAVAGASGLKVTTTYSRRGRASKNTTVAEPVQEQELPGTRRRTASRANSSVPPRAKTASRTPNNDDSISSSKSRKRKMPDDRRSGSSEASSRPSKRTRRSGIASSSVVPSAVSKRVSKNHQICRECKKQVPKSESVPCKDCKAVGRQKAKEAKEIERRLANVSIAADLKIGEKEESQEPSVPPAPVHKNSRVQTTLPPEPTPTPEISLTSKKPNRVQKLREDSIASSGPSGRAGSPRRRGETKLVASAKRPVNGRGLHPWGGEKLSDWVQSDFELPDGYISDGDPPEGHHEHPLIRTEHLDAPVPSISAPVTGTPAACWDSDSSLTEQSDSE